MDAPFTKVEGLGNDFLLVDVRDDAGGSIEAWKAAALRACDRRRGVGGDGILIVAPPRSKGARATMIVVNADGSVPEMCGNGLRCVAAALSTEGQAAPFVVDTGAGPLSCEVLEQSGPDARVRVDMGRAQAVGEHRPEAGAGRVYRSVDMGNPHAVCFVGEEEDPHFLARELGPEMELDPTYPDRTNVEFARVLDGRIDLGVWERGCGITQACGTGACATVAAATWAGLVPHDHAVPVRLLGGELAISVSPEGAVRMEGPARRVFAGTWPLS